MKAKEVVEIALKTGEILLCSGAEIYRVEDTIVRVFRSYNMKCECFVLLTGIFLSTKGENDENITIIKRINNYSFNLKKIEQVNSFSRQLEKKPIGYEQSMDILEKINSIPLYPFPVRLISAGITAFAFAMLFKSTVSEAGIAFLISMLAYTIYNSISKLGFFMFFEYFLAGLSVGSLTLLAGKLYPSLNIYKMIIGAIMIFVPGMAITSGIKDALYGDVVSSIYRLAEAVFIATAVGAGVALVLSIGLRYL